MRKFKLIKEYPGSPKLGTEVFPYNYLDKKSPYTYNGNPTGLLLSNITVENYPEFWQEITELPVGTKVRDTWYKDANPIYEKDKDGKWQYLPSLTHRMILSESEIGVGKRFEIIEEQPKEYEILSVRKYGSFFINGYTEATLRKNGLYLNDENSEKDGQYSLESCLKEGCKIHSIRRISDNSIWTIGDDTNHGKIEHFEIDKFNKLRVDCEEEHHIHRDLSEIQKAKPILFTTEDGVDIYKGDLVIPVNLDTLKICAATPINTGESLRYGNYKHFSTKKAAEDCIILNKPCLSINDFKNILKQPGNLIIEPLKQLVKTKL